MKICADCNNKCARRIYCAVCSSLLCGDCYREHRTGNEQIVGGCAVRMDAIAKAECK